MDFFSQYGRDFNAHNLAQSSYNISRGVGKSMYSGLALQYTKKNFVFEGPSKFGQAEQCSCLSSFVTSYGNMVKCLTV